MEFQPINEVETNSLSDEETLLLTSLWTNSWTHELDFEVPNWRTLMFSLVDKGFVRWRVST